MSFFTTLSMDQMRLKWLLLTEDIEQFKAFIYFLSNCHRDFMLELKVVQWKKNLSQNSFSLLTERE